MKLRRILALSFFPAFTPPSNGGVERLYRVYSELAERFDVTLITSSHVGGTQEVIEHSSNFTEIRVPKDGHFEDCYVSLLADAGEGDVSGPALGMATLKFGPLHDEYLRHYDNADIIVHDFPFLIRCDLFRGFDNKPRVYNSHNFETGLYGSFHNHRTGRSTIGDLVEDLERDACNSADLITACSSDDLNSFREKFAPAAELILVPNGFVPVRATDSIARAKNRLVFLGSAHKPNVDAVELIKTRLAPELPEYEFHLIGTCAPKGRSGNVISHGLVDAQTKHRLLYGATAAINPMASGSGSSLKVADIADHRVPLISTPLGARGFDLKAGVHYLPIELDDLSNTVRAALESDQLPPVAENAFTYFRDRYTWSQVVARFADTLDTLRCRRTSIPLLVLNDYDSFGSTGGGATRTRGLCRGLTETAPVIFLSFGNGDEARRTEEDGRVLVLLVPKTKQHLSEHDRDNELFWISSADIVNYVHGPRNRRMRALFRCAAAASSSIVCEHPYMVGLPRLFGLSFVYSSQNFEWGMKKEGLRDHPRAAALITLVEEAESFACGAATFIIAVSENDAHMLSGSYRFTAPILVIPNGADGPAGERPRPKSAEVGVSALTAVFMGSAHGPNVEAARWIATTLAPALPDIEFIILGGVADGVEAVAASNVKLLGQVTPKEKSAALYRSDIALNPMKSGSGSNVKVADYLQHGLPVISTQFGARGYEHVPSSDLTVAGLDDFPALITDFRNGPQRDPRCYATRQKEYLVALSMDQGGRELARIINEHSPGRPKALYVTYRYNQPSLGGGEAYVVRLIHSLARSGWDVDVVSPAAERITDLDRFAAQFSGDEFQPVPTAVPRIRSAKFPLDPDLPTEDELRAVWRKQPDYEATLARHLRKPKQALPTWGWADPDTMGRWCMARAGLYLPESSGVTLTATPKSPVWLQIFSEQGELVYDGEFSDRFTIALDLPAGYVELRSTVRNDGGAQDPRPLAFYVEELTVGRVSILGARANDVWATDNEPSALFEAHCRAREQIRDPHELMLSELRCGSKQMIEYVRDHVGSYDLVVTHNAVFGAATFAVAAAKEAGVPSILVPHLHFDDDFYHFPDIQRACADATRTLVSPRAVLQSLRSRGLTNVHYHAPGIDTAMRFSPDDATAFRSILGNQRKFFLVLGRKAGAKGYRDVIRAAEQMVDAPLVVLIGPNDDGVEITSKSAIYLGRQPLNVVRGALMECLALINMSTSESFGMVLLEAGLASRPVIANGLCAAFADLVQDEVNGFLVHPDELAAKMSQLADDAKLRKRMGDKGREMALDYHWDAVEADFIAHCNAVRAPA